MTMTRYLLLIRYFPKIILLKVIMLYFILYVKYIQVTNMFFKVKF